MQMTGGQALAQSLKIEGIATLFALPGVQLDYLFDALWEERAFFAIHHTRHEQATAYMADGYARSTGRIGACVVVPGPGLLNTAAAVSTAYACSSPVLVITGQIDSALIGCGRGALHEIPDQLGMIRHITKQAERALRPEDIPAMVHRAARALQSGRPRPVEIEIPPDVLGAVGDVTLLEPETWVRSEEYRAGEGALDEAARLLGRAERPLICAGGGVLSAEAWEEVRELARLLEAPVLMTSNGRGVVSDRDYRAQSGTLAMTNLVTQADAILAIGTRFVLAARMGAADPPTIRGAVIQADIDPDELGRNHHVDVALLGDAKCTAAELVRRVPEHNRVRASREQELRALQQAQREVFDGMPVQRDYVQAIRDALPDDGILVSESTQVGYVAHGGAFPVYEPRTLITFGYQGTLGHGYAAALGVQVGNPDRKVVSINGDGGFMYNVQELSTQARERIPLVSIVFNDNQFGNVRRIQEQRYNGHGMATELLNPDFVKLAELFGIAGHRATTPAELRDTLRNALDARVPALIEVPMLPTQELPALQPMVPLPARPQLNL